MMASPFITSAHPSWKMVCTESLILCKLEVQQAPCEAEAMCGHIVMSLNINPEFNWTLHYLQHQLSAESLLLSPLPDIVNSVTVVVKLIETLDSAKFCIGNSDAKFLEFWQRRGSTLHGIISKQLFNTQWVINFATLLSIIVYILDPGSGHLESKSGCTSIHHNECQYLLPATKQHERCTECSRLRKTLTSQVHRFTKANCDEASASSHVNYRYAKVYELPYSL